MERQVLELKYFLSNYELYLLAKSKNLTIGKINALLKREANIDYVHLDGDSILHHIVDNPNATLEVIRFVLAAGAFPDHRNKNNDPPLAYCKHLSVAKLLIQYTVMTKLFYYNIYVEDYDDEEYRFFGESERILNLHFVRDYYDYSVFRKFRDSCIAEMKSMKQDMIATDYALFYFVVCHNTIKGKKVDHSHIVELMSRILLKKYPSCRDIMCAAIGNCCDTDLTRLCNVRIYFVNPSTENCAEKVIFLNAECIAEIEKNLTVIDTVNLIEAFVHESIFNTKLCSSKRLREELEQSSTKKLRVSRN